MDNQTIIFYHNADLDGKASAAIILEKFPNSILYGVDYYNNLDEYKDKLLDKDIFMVDFSFSDPKDMIYLKENYKDSFIWIDHHKTSIDNSIQYNYNDINGIREIGKSGCELTWKYFNHNKQIPKAIFYLGRYDVWDHDIDKDILPFQYGMRLYENNPTDKIWSTLLENSIFSRSITTEIIIRGNIIIEYERLQNNKISKSQCYTIDFEGYKALVVNRGYLNSLFFNNVYDTYSHDILISYSKYPKNWKVSIYCPIDKDINVAEIAKKYGGGGHKGAAGFYLKDISILL